MIGTTVMARACGREPAAGDPRRRGMSTRMPMLAITLTVGLLAAGCAASRPRPSSPLPSTSATAPTVADNKRAAEQEAKRLLTLMRVPAGATALDAAPPSLPGPSMGPPTTDSLASDARFWRVNLAFADALAWVRAHPPAGLNQFSSYTAGRAPELSSGYGYDEPDSNAWMNARLEVAVAPLTAHASAIRADGLVIWLTPTPVPDTATGPRMRLTVPSGCPASDADMVGVESPRTDLADRMVPAADPTGGLVCRYNGLNGTRFALGGSTRLDRVAATRVAQALARLRLSHMAGTLIRPCPMDDGSVIVLALSYAGQPDVAVWFRSRGCQWVSNGAITAEAGDLGETVDAVSPPR
jgi:hypothetical protein